MHVQQQRKVLWHITIREFDSFVPWIIDEARILRRKCSGRSPQEPRERLGLGTPPPPQNFRPAARDIEVASMLERDLSFSNLDY